MAYRNIFIANNAELKAKNNQLIISNGTEVSFPIEDIRSILIENQSVTLTSHLISQLSDNNVCVLLCNKQHLPSAVLMPINGFSRQSKRLELQIKQTAPFKKRIWQSIVVAKITNQSECLRLIGLADSSKLTAISKSVQSGDTTNREGYAANLYFKSLFGKGFKRDDEIPVNAALNYGYSIVRAYIARTLAVYGLEPSLGIHHKNEYNSFNLADDIIEPFRPVVDLYVKKFCFDPNNEFDSRDKAQLLMLLNAAIMSDGEKCTVATAVDRLVQSYVSAMEGGKYELKLPQLINTEFFKYD